MSRIRGWLPLLALVLVAAYTRPVASAFRLMWSSAMLAPDTATSALLQVVSFDWASWWNANFIWSSLWSLHMIPMRSPPKDTTLETSSVVRPVPPGRAKGVPQVLSPLVVRLTKTCEAWVQVAHN
jgi:hypothetical protein